jgi:plasmid stabilization system protein ParE
LKIIWSPEAADDFESAVTYLVGVNPAAARRLVASVLGLIEWLAVEPVLGPSHVLRNGDLVHGWPFETFSDLLPAR